MGAFEEVIYGFVGACASRTLVDAGDVYTPGLAMTKKREEVVTEIKRIYFSNLPDVLKKDLQIIYFSAQEVLILTAPIIKPQFHLISTVFKLVFLETALIMILNILEIKTKKT